MISLTLGIDAKTVSVTQWVFTILLWAVYPLSIVDQTAIRGNGKENPVEIGFVSTIEERYNNKKQKGILK